MPDEIFVPKSEPNPDTPPPEAAKQEADPKVNLRSADSVLGKGKAAGGKKKIEPKMVVFMAVGGVLAMALVVAPHMIKHPRARRASAATQQQTRPKPNPDLNADGLPTSSVNTPNAVNTQGGNGITAQKVQQLAANGGTTPSASGNAVTGSGASAGQPANPHEKLGGVGRFNAPATPSEGGGWTPPLYAGESYRPAPQADYTEIARERRKALTGKSLVYVIKQQASSRSTAPVSAAAPAPVANFGYATGTYLSTHLEYVASTAVNAPVIADVDYDYERGGQVVIPAGSRLIGSMGASSDTGIVNIRFERIRLPDGHAYPVSAIGLNHDLMPLKGIVTGRHRFEQLLLALGGSTASMSSIFAGGGFDSGFSEASMLRMEAANQAGSFTAQQLGQIQNRVSKSLVVTLAAGTPVQVVFVAPRTVETTSPAKR